MKALGQVHMQRLYFINVTFTLVNKTSDLALWKFIAYAFLIVDNFRFMFMRINANI